MRSLFQSAYRPVFWSYRSVSGLWYWAGRRFTRAGLCVAGALLLAGSTGLDVERTVTYQSFAVLLGLLVIAFATGGSIGERRAYDRGGRCVGLFWRLEGVAIALGQTTEAGDRAGSLAVC